MDSIKQCDKSYHFPDILTLVSNSLLLGLLARYQWPNMLMSYNLAKVYNEARKTQRTCTTCTLTMEVTLIRMQPWIRLLTNNLSECLS